MKALPVSGVGCSVHPERWGAPDLYMGARQAPGVFSVPCAGLRPQIPLFGECLSLLQVTWQGLGDWAFSGAGWPWSERWEGLAGPGISREPYGGPKGQEYYTPRPPPQLRAQASRSGAAGLHGPDAGCLSLSGIPVWVFASALWGPSRIPAELWPPPW